MKLFTIGITFIIIMFIIIGGCISDHSDETYKLYSLNTITGSSGSFSLGHGYIDEEAYYFYYLQDNDGAYHLTKSNVECSRIFMDTTNDTAHVTKIDCCGPNSKSKPSCSGYCCYNYDFHVPKGTITIQFNGDVKKGE